MSGRQVAESTNDSRRHRDDGRWLGRFLGDHCEVLCPRCGRLGVVRYAMAANLAVVAKFACPQCVLVLESGPQWPFSIELVPGAPWYGRLRFSGSRICGYCGEKWLRRNIESGSVMPAPFTAETIVVCPVCGREHPLELQAVRIHDYVRGCEPVFGIALALSEPVASGKYVWAYNYEHLAALKTFIGANLRERGPVANASLFSRLPAWFKSARNREKLTKAISRIEQRYGASE